MDKKNIVIVGLPRSGSTLTCNLINKLPNAVALHEPMNVRQLAKQPDRLSMYNEISKFFKYTRRSLEESCTAISKHISGSIPKNPVGTEHTSDGLRKSAVNKGDVFFDKPLSANFILAVKHNSAFAALLPDLQTHFLTYAVIRNPVAVLLSWNSVELQVQNGHAPAAENIDTNLRTNLASVSDRLDRQVYLLSWFYERFSQLPMKQIIRYEELISSGGNSLQIVAASAKNLQEPLQNQNRNELYNSELIPVLVDRLTQLQNGAFLKFYSLKSIEAFRSN